MRPKLNYSREELAALLGTKPQTLAAWACRGRGPRFWKRKRRVFYRAGDVAAWLDNPAAYEAALEIAQPETGAASGHGYTDRKTARIPQKTEENDG